MNPPDLTLPPHHKQIFDRFILACQADERIVAAFLFGSYARGITDEHSDLDLGVLTADDASQDFIADKWNFMRQLGEPLFQEDFDYPDMAFFIYANGAECELHIIPHSQLNRHSFGTSRVLLDKTGLSPQLPITTPVAPENQVQTLSHLIFWFWHDMAHFITALSRRQLWWAQGQLEALRGFCISLARLRHDFSAPAGLGEPYFKVEKFLAVEMLAQLQSTFVPMEPEAMLRAVQVILRFYQELARPLAREHGLEYPDQLENIFVKQFDDVAKMGRNQ